MSLELSSPRASTPLSVVSQVSYWVTRITDEVTTDRADYPLLVSLAGVEALRLLGIPSQVIFGSAAWIEVLEDQTLRWAGAWTEANPYFWVQSEFHEVIDLTVSVSHRMRSQPNQKGYQSLNKSKVLFSPPLLWSQKLPRFCVYDAIGIAEIELNSQRDIQWFEKVVEQLKSKISLDTKKDTQNKTESDLIFPDEPLLYAQKILDDSQQRFKHYDRALSLQKMPPFPKDFQKGHH